MAIHTRALRGEDWWRNQWARAVIWVAVSKPCSSSGVGWGGGVPLGQRISRRRVESRVDRTPTKPDPPVCGQQPRDPARRLCCSAEFAVFEEESDQPSELLGVFWSGGELVLELNKSASILELNSSSRSISLFSRLIRCS